MIMDIGITECYICYGLVSSAGVYDHSLRQHEAWHQAQEEILYALKRRIEILEGLVRDPQ